MMNLRKVSAMLSPRLIIIDRAYSTGGLRAHIMDQSIMARTRIWFRSISCVLLTSIVDSLPHVIPPSSYRIRCPYPCSMEARSETGLQKGKCTKCCRPRKRALVERLVTVGASSTHNGSSSWMHIAGNLESMIVDGFERCLKVAADYGGAVRIHALFGVRGMHRPA